MDFSFKKRMRPVLFALILGSLVLSACGGTFSLSPATPTPTVVPATPTPVPPKKLTICLGTEPTSLYLYGGSTQSMWSVLESIYDGPIDIVNYQPQPVILKEIPSQANGGVTVQSAQVSEGDLVADTEGDLVALKKGVQVFPAGCTSLSCAVTWDGTSDLGLSQESVKFTLLSGLKWSDGQPLTAADSVFSYQIAGDSDTATSKVLVNKTVSYTALDDQTVQWLGVPGYLTLNVADLFWSPLPKHQLGQFTAKQLNTQAESTRQPLGWGPYMIDAWQSGDIHLVKNPNYFRSSEGLPYFDEIDYKFLGNLPEPDLATLLTGQCDIIDTSVDLTNQLQTVRQLEKGGKLKGYYSQGPDWQAINFGIKPASYDDSYNPYNDRQDFFGDVRTRQAVADCIDRQTIIKDNLFSLSELPSTYLTSNNPSFVSGLPTYTYDPGAGEQLLDAVGWKDADNNPDTPRVADGVATVMAGTPFEITYTVTDTVLNEAVSQTVASNLQQCGIKVDVKLVSAADMYSPGPSGVIFGRNFDLAQLGWTSASQNPCFLFSSSEIPTAANNWMGTKYGGVNLTGYSNDTYDQACQAYLSAGLDANAASQANAQALTQLASDVPFIPLYFNPKVMVSRPDLCGLTLDASARSGLQEIEKIKEGSACSQ